MQNCIQREGFALQFPAPTGGVVSGQAVVFGKLFTIASETVPAGQISAFWRKGVFRLPKTSVQAWACGDALYWDATNSVVTNVNSGSLLPVGYAADVAANPSTLGAVLIAQAAA